MNWIATTTIRRRPVFGVAFRSRCFAVLLQCLACCAACGSPVSDDSAPGDTRRYQVTYEVSPNNRNGTLDVTLKLRQPRSLLRELTMRHDARLTALQGDGELETENGQVRWRPPADGGSISWRVHVEHRRNDSGYDAWLGPEWGLFRAEDIIPRAKTRTLKGARSDTHLAFDLPTGWSVVTQYYGDDHGFNIRNPERRFDQPNGWIVMGEIGVRRERIAGTRVAVAGPVANSVRRMDTLALLNWTLPELARLLPELPRRITVISAGEPMWRGGLSAPLSMFVHAERPLISENATSTVLHEIMHISLGITARQNFDWIVEGLAEYYSLELLMRSGTISSSRYKTAKSDQADWGKTASTLCRRMSTGATSALAVTVLTALDKEIRGRTDGANTLDDVLRMLWQAEEPVDVLALVEMTEQLTGHKPDALHIDKLPGCRNIMAGH